MKIFPNTFSQCFGSLASTAVFLLVVATHPSDAFAQTPSIVDWTAFDPVSRTATGSMDGESVTLSWSANGNVPLTYFQGNAFWFDSIAFTPPYESTDGMEIQARRSEQGVPSYTITFASPVANPVLHLSSLASTFAFVGAVPRRVSGDERFIVSGNAVSGTDHNEPNGIDANGTITFSGSYSSLTFTAEYAGTAPTGKDGIIIQVGAMPGSTLVGLEVVQVVQDWRNDVPLVAGKDTVVRAHMNKSVDPPFSGRIEAELWAFDSQGLPMIPPFIRNVPDQSGETLELPWLVNESTREDLNASVNFYLPDEWTVPGNRTFLFQSSVGTPTVACAEQARPVSNDCAVSVEFVARQPIRVQAINTIFWDIQTTASECAETGGVYLEFLGICSYQTDIVDQLQACRRIEAEMPTHEVVCLVDQNPIVLEPANERPMTLGINREVISRKNQRCSQCGDFYMAITRFAARGGQSGAAYYPETSPDVYRTGWARAVNQSPGTVVHELGHNLGLRHPSFSDATPGDQKKEGTCGETVEDSWRYPPSNDEFFPYYHTDSLGNRPRLGPIMPMDTQKLVYGFDSLSMSVVSHRASALMGYCRQPSRWNDINSYGVLFGALAPGVATRETTVLANAEDYFWVTGDWNRTTDMAHLDPIEIVRPSAVPVIPMTGALELVVHSSAGPDVIQPLEPSALPDEPDQFTFHGWVPRAQTITGFTVRRNAITLAQTQVSQHAPQVSIVGPAPGDTYIGQDITLGWTASDTDGDPLTFRIDYSIDGGATWEMLSSSWQTSSFVVNSDLLRSTPSAQFRVIAMDGFLSSTAVMSGTIAVISSKIFDSGFE